MLGKPAAAFSLSRTAQLPVAPAAPVQLPASLLERRPDIAAAEGRTRAYLCGRSATVADLKEVGGLLLSQVLTLYTTPVIYLALDRVERWILQRCVVL